MCVCACVRACMHACMHAGMYVCMYVCMYVYVFIRHGYIHKLSAYNGRPNENDYNTVEISSPIGYYQYLESCRSAIIDK